MLVSIELSIHYRSGRCIQWAYASVSYAYAHRRVKIPNLKRPSKHANHVRKELMHFECACQELMRALSVRIRNWCACWVCASEIKYCIAPPKVKVTSLYLSLKFTNPERLYCVKIMKIRGIENLTLLSNIIHWWILRKGLQDWSF